MARLWALARKDLLLLLRDRGALFLTAVWPLVIAAFFGALGPGFGSLSGAEAGGGLRVVTIDNDQSPASRALLAELAAHDQLSLETGALEPAREQVRRGERAAYLHIDAGFGAAPSQLFDPVAPQRRVELGVDPRRANETALLTAALELAAWRQLGAELPGAGETRPVKPLAVETTVLDAAAAGLGSVARPPSPFAVTFPQGMIWAVIACAATFAASLVNERNRGTLLRLAVAPLSRLEILAGKALACLVTIVVMELVLLAVAVLGFGVRPHSWPLLALAMLATAIAFVGVMSLLAVLGRRTQSAAGLSWGCSWSWPCSAAACCRCF